MLESWINEYSGTKQTQHGFVKTVIFQDEEIVNIHNERRMEILLQYPGAEDSFNDYIFDIWRKLTALRSRSIQEKLRHRPQFLELTESFLARLRSLSPDHLALSQVITEVQNLGVRSQMSTMPVKWVGGIPSLEDVVEDIKAAGKNAWIRNANEHVDHDSKTKLKDFLLSLKTFLDSPQTSPIEELCLSAWCIPETKNGMGKYSSLFGDMVEPYIVVDKGATLTQPGSCSDVHIDYSGLSVYITPVGGPKLIFIFPPTEKNVCEFKRFHCLEHKIMLFEFLEKMEEWRFAVLHPGRGIRLPPGTIHAVVSIECSASYGPTVAEYRALQEAATAMRWEFTLMTERKLDQSEMVRGTVKEIKTTLLQAHQCWLQLAQKIGGDQQKNIEETLSFLHELYPRGRPPGKKSMAKVTGSVWNSNLPASNLALSMDSDRFFTTSKGLQLRIGERENETCIICTVCEKIFITSDKFTDHWIGHTSPKFSCKTCGKKLTSTSGLSVITFTN